MAQQFEASVPRTPVVRSPGPAAFAIAAIAAAALLLIGGAGGFLLQRHFSTDELTSQIDARIAELGVKPSSVEITSQTALRARRAIMAGDFATAGRIARDVLGRSAIQNWRFSPFGDFIAGMFATIPPELGSRLDDWVAQDATGALPLLFRAQYLFAKAWDERGHEFDDKTAPERLVVFANDLDKALVDVNASIGVEASDPYSFYLKLRIVHSRGNLEQFAADFKDAIAKYPTYYPLYEIALDTLQPRWGGTIPAMYAFVETYAGGAPQFSPLKLLYLSLYRHLLSTASVQCVAYGIDSDKTTQCVAAYMQKAILPGLEDKVLAALQLYDHTDKFEFGVEVKGILADMLATTDGDAYSGAVLQLAATSMHSDAQLKETSPGHNDFLVDELVALSWRDKGFYENETAKEEEALTDSRAATFPSDDEKNAQLAAIYENLADAASHQRRYVDEIAFERAAVLLGVTLDEQYICHGYYALKRYDDAIKWCGEALDQSDDVNIRYWRGEAYHASNRQDQALTDLGKSADSENYLGSYAAITMSMIYFDRNDNQGALNVLNQYNYLYDPNRVEKSQVAVAYNNRCYAYMQLGDLKKALDDCTHSLKYGSIPDAFRKQQELVKRLATP